MIDNIKMLESSETSPHRKSRRKLWKFKFIMIILSILLFVVLARLFDIQILNHYKYTEIAKKQHHSKVDINPERGLIVDRNGNILSKDILSISVACDPSLFKSSKPETQEKLNKQLRQICNFLSLLSDKSADFYYQKISNSNKEFVWLIRFLSPKHAESLNQVKSRGLILIDEQRRFYPYQELATQIIGCTNLDHIGISGIERSFDSILKGSGGYMYMHRDGFGYLRPSASLPIQDAYHGNDIYLTIDINFQEIVEYELKQGIKKYEAQSGLVVAMNPKSGEIIAMASYPTFNPNNVYRQDLNPMKIKAITDTYEPGSTFKLITASIALEEKLITKNEIFDAYDGLLKIGNVNIRDEYDLREGNLAEAMKYSSNIIFAQIASRIKTEVFINYVKRFGSGKITGIELPGEAKGKLPDIDNFNSNDKKFLGFGYGITATPIQILNSYNAIANSGKLLKPYIVNKIVTKDGNTIFENSPKIVSTPVSEKTAKYLTELLVEVIESGTGKNAKINGLKIAGKTGTSQQIEEGAYSKQHYTATFVGFFPADNPEISMIVILDRPKSEIYGGAAAAPIFKNIVRKWLNSANFYRTIAKSNIDNKNHQPK